MESVRLQELSVAGFGGSPYQTGRVTIHDDIITYLIYDSDGGSHLDEMLTLRDVENISARMGRLGTCYLIFGGVSAIASLVLWNPLLAFGAWSFFTIAQGVMVDLVIETKRGTRLVWATREWRDTEHFSQYVQRALVEWRTRHCSAGHPVL